ncbi:MAG: dienelactone hydrolase family protein, partial [Burkholderiaceae bacterium]|nr:dienelactone hydrolase family protein [Burkholderiaceae bacterium]
MRVGPRQRASGGDAAARPPERRGPGAALRRLAGPKALKGLRVDSGDAASVPVYLPVRLRMPERRQRPAPIVPASTPASPSSGVNVMLRPETQSLVAAREAVSRRGFVQTSLGAGFAAAVLPVAAQAIKTSAEGLDAGETTLTVDGAKVPMYFAKPKGKSGLPVVLVVSEIFGVHEYIADTARRFAKAGYLAIAPEFFVRQGDPTQFGT